MAKEIIVRVRAEGQEKFIKQMKAAGLSVEEVGDKTKKAGGKMSGSFKKIGAAIGAAFATQQLIAFGKELAKTAIEIDATNKKLQIVFGDSAKAVDDFARRSATSLGLTVNEYKKAAAAAGDLLVPIGFQRKQAADLSNDLVKLSGALSAWTGGQLNASQVSEILTKALLGEREQLKQLGIQISEADIKSKLLEKGQAKLTGTALAQAKALASLELITAKSADAQAAFNDSTKTLAESQLELTANIRQFKDDLAEELIPVLADLFGWLNDKVIPSLQQAAKGWRVLKDPVSAYKEELIDLNKRELQLYENKVRNAIQNKKDVEGNKIGRADLARLNNLLKAIVERRQELYDQTKNNINASEEENDVIEEQIRSLTFLNEKLKEQKNIIAKTDPLSSEFFAAALEAERLKIEIENINKALDDYIDKIFRADPGEAFELPSDTKGKIIKDRSEIAEGDLQVSVDLAKIKKKLKQDEIDNNREAEEEIKNERIRKANEGLEISQTAISGVLQLQQQAIQAEIQALEDKNKRGEISDKEYQEKKAELLTKAAKADKAAALTDAIVNTAVGITAMFQAGPVAGFALAAIAAALGAAQIALIASQPIPQFAKGTKGKKKAPAGFKWVGEEGPELLFDGGGYDVLTAGDSEQLSNILASYSIPVQFTRTEDELNKPIKSIKDITSNNAFNKIDWNPLLNASDMQRRSLGKKLDVVNYNLTRINNGLTRRKTAN